MEKKSVSTSQSAKQDPGMQLLMILCILLPLMIFFLLPGGGLVGGGMFFWMGLLFCFWMMSMLFGAFAGRTAENPPPLPTARTLSETEQPAAIKEVMDVRFAEEDEGVRIFSRPAARASGGCLCQAQARPRCGVCADGAGR